MSWFSRSKRGIESQEKKNLPDGLWIKCEECGEIVYNKELEKNHHVCSACSFHFQMSGKQYINLLMDGGVLLIFNDNIQNTDPLKFRDNKKYTDRVKEAVKKTNMKSAVQTGIGRINSHEVVMAIMEFAFIGGSMGSVVGEKISRAIDVALERKIPLIIISASGGARMMEGVLSLMQMAKTSAKLGLLGEAGIPFISILTHPTTGGVSASFAMLGDLILAEPGALIGFAGPRVIKQTIGQDLPKGFQRTEFLHKHGFVDSIIHRKEMKQRISEILDFFTA
jgi:acetyl-CoA carboxylase carboxyl transferase subunit beta